MNRAEVAALLTLAAAYDRRTIGEAEVLAWHAIVDDLSFAEGERALRAHYAETERFAMPSDVRKRAIVERRRRHELAHSERVAIETRRERQTPDEIAAGIAKVVAALDAAKGLTPEQRRERGLRDDERRRARSVRCPYCRAAEGRPCVIPETSTELTKQLAHPSRIELVASQARS